MEGEQAPISDLEGKPHLLAWRALTLREYRGALRVGRLSSDIYFEQPPRLDLPTVVFIHGSRGAPAHFASLAGQLWQRFNCAAFAWDCSSRLASAAEILRAAILRLPGRVIVVAHSMGALLPAYLGATDRSGAFRHVAALYLNPLIGGSRYAGDLRIVAWLGVGPILQRIFFRPSFADLAPESAFQQTICARTAARSSFADRTLMLFTEKPGAEPDIPPARVPYYFGQTREQILPRLGSLFTASAWPANGHKAPLQKREIVLPALDKLVVMLEESRSDASAHPGNLRRARSLDD